MLKFIGFQELEDVVKPRVGIGAAHMNRVYVCSSARHFDVAPHAGYYRAEVFVQVIDPEDTNIIRYWCMFVGRIETESRKAVNPAEHNTLTRRCSAAVAALTEYYEAQGYHVDEGIIDAPTDLFRMRGAPDGLTWHPDTETFTIDLGGTHTDA